MNFEEKLHSLAQREIVIPDPDNFVDSLHITIKRKNQTRQEIQSGIVALFIIVVVSIVLLNRVPKNFDEWYLSQGTLDLITSNDFDYYPEDWLEEDQFTVEVVEYLIEQADFSGSGWDLIKNLDEIGILQLPIEETGG